MNVGNVLLLAVGIPVSALADLLMFAPSDRNKRVSASVLAVHARAQDI